MSALFKGLPLFSKETAGGTGVPNGGGLNTALAGLGAVFCFDLADSTCYATKGTTAVANIITTPADGETQATYGATIVAGQYHINDIGKSNSALLVATAGVFFDQRVGGAYSPTPFTNSMHKAGALWTVSMTFKTYDVSGTNEVWYTSRNGTGATRLCVSIVKVSNTSIELRISNGSTYQVQHAFTIPALTSFKDYNVTCTFNDTAGTANLYINGTKYTATGLTMASPSATNDTFSAGQFGYGSGSDGFVNGAVLKGYVVFNTALNDAGELTCRGAWEASHSISYTD